MVIKRKPTQEQESTYYENEVTQRPSQPSATKLPNMPESAYDGIDPQDIDMSSNVYDQVETGHGADRGLYETVN